MGRYYSTDSGKQGKFMFAIQPSHDPELLGMRKIEPNVITYSADENDFKNIKSKLDLQYEQLEIPKNERKYSFKKNEAREKYLDEIVQPRAFETVKRESARAQATHNRWASEKGDEFVDLERFRGSALCYGRVRLALIILSDIKEQGYCELEAEC